MHVEGVVVAADGTFVVADITADGTAEEDETDMGEECLGEG
jgi:hypothetical protein